MYKITLTLLSFIGAYCKNAAIVIIIKMKYCQRGLVLLCSYSFGILNKLRFSLIFFVQVPHCCDFDFHTVFLFLLSLVSLTLPPASSLCLSPSPIFKHLKHWGLLRDVNCTQIMFDRARREVTAERERERGMSEWKDNCSGEGHCDWRRFGLSESHSSVSMREVRGGGERGPLDIHRPVNKLLGDRPTIPISQLDWAN